MITIEDPRIPTTGIGTTIIRKIGTTIDMMRTIGMMAGTDIMRGIVIVIDTIRIEDRMIMMIGITDIMIDTTRGGWGTITGGMIIERLRIVGGIGRGIRPRGVLQDGIMQEGGTTLQVEGRR